MQVFVKRNEKMLLGKKKGNSQSKQNISVEELKDNAK